MLTGINVAQLIFVGLNIMSIISTVATVLFLIGLFNFFIVCFRYAFLKEKDYELLFFLNFVGTSLMALSFIALAVVTIFYHVELHGDSFFISGI